VDQDRNCDQARSGGKNLQHPPTLGPITGQSLRDVKNYYVRIDSPDSE
jgi:hypothetical protein